MKSVKHAKTMVAFIGWLVFAGTSVAADRPNILVILTDDQGWGDLSVNGNSNLSTPNIDSLARDGAIFDRFYVCPVCAPTRAEFLTGRYHPRGGVRGVSTGFERLNLNETTIADIFKKAGYATGAFGKWHNGTQYPYHPKGRGFDEFYGFCSGHWGDYFDPPLESNGKPIQGKGFIADDLTDHAISFMRSNRDRPFFCYVPFNTPHSPMQVPDRFFDKFKNADLKLKGIGPPREDINMTRAALAMCENIDWNVGRLLKTLDESAIADNTIVVYFSDNGPMTTRWNGGMRGRKGSTDEGGVRSPLLIRGPGRIKAGTKVPSIAGAIDLMPTLLDWAGIPLDPNLHIDGMSLAPILAGQGAAPADRMIFSVWSGKYSVRTQRYRLDDLGRLYDMVDDPGQTKDATQDRPEEKTRLASAVAEWKREMQGGLGKDDRPYPCGHPEFPLTFLPARDGVPHGLIRRSAAAPNCSFFTGWSKHEDSISWDLEVVTTGRYEVMLYYTCPAVDVGSTIAIEFLGRRLEGKVTEAFNPPLRGAENDRVTRGGESLVKEFKPLRLGAISLPKGRGPLVLRALDIPGRTVMDLRAVSLNLVESSGDTSVPRKSN